MEQSRLNYIGVLGSSKHTISGILRLHNPKDDLFHWIVRADSARFIVHISDHSLALPENYPFVLFWKVLYRCVVKAGLRGKVVFVAPLFFFRRSLAHPLGSSRGSGYNSF